MWEARLIEAAALVVVERECRVCRQPFVITVEEQRFYGELAAVRDGEWQLPRRCARCRAARRRVQYEQSVDPAAPDEMLVCCDCGRSFIFGGRDRAYFAAHGFVVPKRCRECRRSRNAAPVAEAQ